ncbi:MAG: hypothetical protein H7332_03225 [Bdellovibrionales bacterium]|nr:hypothetical protein [Ramlibacter sp.]
MNTKTLRSSILLASLLAVGGFATAQSATTAKGDGTDNKVKAEAAATTTTTSDKTRADVKAEAKADNKAMAMPKNKTGEGADLANKPNPAGDMKARADVKAEANMPLKTGEGADKGVGQTEKKVVSKKRRKAASMAS